MLRTFDYCSYVERNSFVNQTTGISVAGSPSRDADFLKKYQGKNFQPQKLSTNLKKVSTRKPVQKTRKAFDFPVPKTHAAERAQVAIATAASVQTGKEKVREKPIPPPKPRGRSASPKFDAQMFQPDRSFRNREAFFKKAMEDEKAKIRSKPTLTEQLKSSFDSVASKATDKIEDFAECSTEFLQGLKGRHCENGYWNQVDGEKSVFMGETFADTRDHRFWEKAPCEQTKAILGIPQRYRYTREVIDSLAQLPWTLGHLVFNKIDVLMWSEKAEERRKAFRALKFWSISMTGDWLMTTLSLQAMALLLDIPYVEMMEFHLSSFEFIPQILQGSFLEGDVVGYNDATNPLTKSLICRVFFQDLDSNVQICRTYIGSCYRLVKLFVKENPLEEGSFYGTEDFRRLKVILRDSIDTFHESKDKSWMQTGVRLRTCWDGLYSKIHQNWVAFSYLSGMLATLVVASTATYLLTKEDQTPYTSSATFKEQIKKMHGFMWTYADDEITESMIFEKHSCRRHNCDRDIVVGASVEGSERFYCKKHAPFWYQHCDSHNINTEGFQAWCLERVSSYERTPLPGKVGVQTQSLGKGHHSRVPGRPGMKPQSLGGGNRSRVPGKPGLTPHSLGSGNHSRIPGKPGYKPQDETSSFTVQSHVDGMVDHSFVSISANFRELEFHYPQKGIALSVRCLFSGRRALTIGHFFDTYGLGFNKVVVKNGDVAIHTFPSTQVRVTSRGAGRDVWSVDFPNHMNAMSSLNGKLYATKDDMLRHMSLSTQFERLHRTYKNGTTIIQSVAAKKVTLSVNPVKEASNLTTSYFLQGHYIMMGTYGNPGDCALPYVHKDDSGATKIVGLHVGLGGESNGYCSPIFQSDFTDDNFSVQCAEAPAWLKMVDSPAEPQTCDKQTVFMGIIDKPAFIPGKTEYVASPAQGDTDTEPMCPIKTAPAVLDVTTWETGETVEPLKLALEKLNNAHVRPLPDWMAGATLSDIDLLTEGFFPKGMDLTKIVPWTMMEVLFGKAGTSWTGLRKDSSIGPDVKRFIPGVTSRDQLWGIRDGKQWVHPLFVKLIVDICRIVKSGNEPKNVVEGCLKDEPRTIDRVLAGKTRLFCVGSLSHLVWTIMWMGGLVTEMKNHRDKSDVSIGTNVHGFDWKLIYNNLMSMHDSVHGAGDVSGMDTSERAWWGWILAEACSRFYNFDKGSYEDNSIRYACQSSLCPILIIGRNVYWMDYFNSSGGWLTGFLNSFVSVVIFNVAVIIVQHQNKERDPVFAGLSVREFLRRAFYGDDNAWSILRKYSKYLDMSILAKIYMDVFGIEYTTPGKGKITEKFLEFSDIDYLARKFRLQGNAVFAPLSEESIHSMLNWIKKPKTQIVDGVRIKLTLEEQWLINVETACQEWFHYGSERFEKETSHMRARVRMLGLPWPGKSYDEYLFRWTNGLQPLASVEG
uniref:RNA-dependent RNA polymerase n=1 Tax=Picornavirales sp. TaxID=1955153 RepID=A0A514DC08_9VIRU|nr:MAG: RNA-dependent RNA polymerase [Picornavirales sp.]